MEHQQDTIEKAWKYYEHADNLFTGRINFFLVAESMVLVAYVTLLQEECYEWLRLAIAILGIVYTFIWFYTNFRLAKRTSFLSSAYLEQDIIYKKYLCSTPKTPSSQNLMTYGLPIPTGILWAFLLSEMHRLPVGIGVSLLWMLVVGVVWYKYWKYDEESKNSGKNCWAWSKNQEN